MTDADDGPDDGAGERPVEQPRNRVPTEGAVVRDRFSSDEVFQRIVAAADEEITSSTRELFFAGVAGGLAITITYLLYASMTASTGGDPVLSVLLYPIGFIYIIIGGYQLYTENTLPPVALTLERLASVTRLLRHWVIVLAGNFTGGAIGAIVLAAGGVFSPGAAVAAEDIALKGIETDAWNLFFKGTFAGLIVAGVVWVEYAARDTISRLVVIYLAFLCIPLGNLFHVVVSFTEVVYLLLVGEAATLPAFGGFVVPVLLGNTIGGIVLVTVVNYYQTSERRLGSISGEERINRLTTREWLFGRWVGRAYVPLLEHHDRTAPAGEGYRVLVPVSNPRTEGDLVRLAAIIAGQEPAATVHVAHMVQIPPGNSLQYDARQRARIRSESQERLDDLAATIEGEELEVETSTVVSYRTFEEIFNQANRDDADLVVMDWGEGRHWGSVRSSKPIDELTRSLPCDFLVLKDRDLDTSRVLLPTAGGPDSHLSADVARALEAGSGSEISLLHVVDGPEERAAGEEFLETWAAENGLASAEAVVDVSGDVERAIATAADDCSLIVLGATEQGMLARLRSDSLHLDVVDDVDCSVILAERPKRRGLRELLFGK